MKEILDFGSQKYYLSCDIDHRFFSALLSVFIVVIVKTDFLSFERLLLLLITITILSFWMKVSISLYKELIRWIVYLFTCFLAYMIGPIMVFNCNCCYNTNEVNLLQYLFPSIVAFWLLSQEMNKINWKRQLRDVAAFGETVYE